MSRAYRLLKIISLLRNSSGHNAASLAQECGVSERTIYRDLNELSLLGIPFYYGEEGYQLHSDTFLPSLNFSLEELLSLQIALRSSLLEHLSPINEHLRSAMLKLSHASGSSSYGALRLWESSVFQHPKVTAKSSAYQSLFPLLEGSIRDRRRIIIKYNSPQRRELVTRKLDPYALTFRRHAWYLVALCHLRGEMRLFRADRIQSLEATGEEFQRDEDFSVERFFADSWEVYQGELVEVTVKFSPRIAPFLKETVHHPNEQISELEDGSVIYTVRVKGVEEISHWILGFGCEAEVLKPKSLRKKIKKIAQGLSIIYDL